MEFEILSNGNLRLRLDLNNLDEKEEVAEMFENSPHKDHAFLADLVGDFTGWAPNGRLYQVQPEDIGALTDAPILTDDLTIEDDGTRRVEGTVWWYPEYQVKSFGKELMANGFVDFTLAPAS